MAKKSQNDIKNKNVRTLMFKKMKKEKLTVSIHLNFFSPQIVRKLAITHSAFLLTFFLDQEETEAREQGPTETDTEDHRELSCERRHIRG